MLLPEEQKGSRRKSKGTDELLFIDKMVFWEMGMRKKNLAAACIDYKKGYDRVPHSWISERCGMVKVSEQIKHFLSECMKESLARIDVKQRIFQNDSLSPLVFVFCLFLLTVMLRKSESAYQFSSNKVKINYLLFMDD